MRIGEHSGVVPEALKYLVTFKSADAIVINKIDIAEAVEFDRAQAIANLQRIAPQASLLEVSAKTGQRMETWYVYLQTARQARVQENRELTHL